MYMRNDQRIENNRLPRLPAMSCFFAPQVSDMKLINKNTPCIMYVHNVLYGKKTHKDLFLKSDLDHSVERMKGPVKFSSRCMVWVAACIKSCTKAANG